jgi:hypothetical protein
MKRYRMEVISMLLSFKLGGYTSFKDMEEIFFTPYPGTRLKNTKYENNFSEINKHKIMKSAVIFGSNASGKTNVLMGIETLKNLLLNGLNLSNEFSKDQLNNESQAIEFEISLLGKDSKEYTYFLKYNSECVLEEKLLKDEKEIYSFNTNELKSKSKLIKKELLKVFSIKSTELLIKKLKDYDIDEISMFLDGIKMIEVKRDELLNYHSKDFINRFTIEDKKLLEKEKSQVLKILKLLDNTINDLIFIKIGDNNKDEIYQIYFEREISKQKFSLGIESEGIKKIMYLIKDILGIYQGKTIIIDELDSSISTRTLIELFNNIVNVKENQNGQLIVSSHNLLLFDNDIFEPQQIYIINKGANLSSEIYSLAEFNIRTEKRNLYLDYLKGKFGGING